jgi:protein SCO1/2
MRKRAFVFSVLAFVASGLVALATVPPASAMQKSVSGREYSCPMHAEIKSNAPGKCPKCRMALTQTRSKAYAPAETTEALSALPIAENPRIAESKGKEQATEAPVYAFPNVVLYTQENKPVRFYDDLLKGKIVLINFIFTTCTDLCPLTTANLVKVQKLLGERLGGNFQMLSISVDPTADTPAKLKAYAASQGVGPGWYFLTGSSKEIDQVRVKLGLYDKDKMQHTGLVVIGNEEMGRWMAMPALMAPANITNTVMKLIVTKKG